MDCLTTTSKIVNQGNSEIFKITEVSVVFWEWFVVRVAWFLSRIHGDYEEWNDETLWWNDFKFVFK